MYTSIPEVDSSVVADNDAGTDNCNEGNDGFKMHRTPAQQRALHVLTITTWFSMISFGLFAIFHYVRRAWIVGDWDSWELSDLHLYRPQHPNANRLMSTHMFIGFFLMMAGPVQLIPFLRQNHIQVHRWTGRIYIICALLTASMATTFVLLYRTSRFDIYEDVGNILFGSAMIISAIESYRHVKYTKNMEAHKWWSYRLFAVVLSTVLFRLIMALYLAPLTLIPSSCHGIEWIYQGIYFVFCLPTWLVLLMYQRLPPKTTAGGPPQGWRQRVSGWIHSAQFFWAATILLLVTTLLVLVFDWIPSILNIDVGQAQGLEHPF